MKENEELKTSVKRWEISNAHLQKELEVEREEKSEAVKKGEIKSDEVGRLEEELKKGKDAEKEQREETGKWKELAEKEAKEKEKERKSKLEMVKQIEGMQTELMATRDKCVELEKSKEEERQQQQGKAEEACEAMNGFKDSASEMTRHHCELQQQLERQLCAVEEKMLLVQRQLGQLVLRCKELMRRNTLLASDQQALVKTLELKESELGDSKALQENIATELREQIKSIKDEHALNAKANNEKIAELSKENERLARAKRDLEKEKDKAKHEHESEAKNFREESVQLETMLSQLKE